MPKELKGEVKDKPTEEKKPSDMEEEVEEHKGILEIPGIGPKTAEKLKELGYGTLVALATARADEVSAEMKVSFSVAKTWIQYAQERILKTMKLQNSVEYDREKKNNTYYFKTGSKAFNELLGGGFATRSTTGLIGRFSTGKTQACFDAIVDCLANTKRKAVYIETEPDTFHLDRLKEIAEAKGYNNIDWDRLYVCPSTQIPTVKAQYLQYKLIQKACESGEDIGLVVVDSFTAKFRPGYSRTEMLPIRSREIAEHFMLIDYLANKYNIAWILTCQVMGAPRPEIQGKVRVKTGIEYMVVGGELLLHSMSKWIAVEQIKTELYEAVLFDSSHLPRGKIHFMIAKSGLMDAVE